MKNYLLSVLLLHLVTLLSIILDISVLRQVFGCIYLTFVPGYVILKALRVDKNEIDTILLSVGVSLSFLMFVGVVMCALFPLFGFARPLSLFPLVLVISSAVLCILLIGCRHDITQSDFRFPTFNVFWIPLFIIPILGVVGAIYDNVFVLLVMITAMAILCFFGFSSRIMPARYHILIVLIISIALVLHTVLISRYIMGEDIHVETYVFKQTLDNGIWTSPGVGVDTSIARFASVLSITILPTVYSIFLNSNIETIFKIIFPLLFSLVPLVLYRIFELQTSKTIALLSTLFFMSSSITFFGMEPLTLARQEIAEVLFVLSIFLLVEKSIPMQKRRLLLIVIGAGLIVSHYALAYLYILLVILSFIILRKWRSKDVLNLSLILLLFAMTFAWYLYVSNAPLLKISDDIARIERNFAQDLYNPAARSSQVATLASSPETIVGVINRVVTLAQYFFILVGIVILTLRGQKTGFDAKYRIMSIVAMLVLVFSLVIPDLAGAFNLTRLIAITMIFLAPFFVLGGETLFSSIGKAVSSLNATRLKQLKFGRHKNISIVLVSLVLVTSFLFCTGFIEHVTGVYPQSWALDKDRKRTSSDIGIRMSYYNEIPVEQDVVNTIWLSKHVNDNGSLYGAGSGIWYSYGMLSPDRYSPLYAFTDAQKGSYAYVSYVWTLGLLNTSSISPSLALSNKIYSNGASESYSTPG
jgi:uncharacterized membrane protein